MIPFLGCERARDLLDAYVDEELSVPDQIAVETHLRVCDTCAARVEDLRLIASSLRFGSSGHPSTDEERALAGIQESTLIRVRTERDQAFGARLRLAFADDLRLLWPALGAVAAVGLGVLLAFGMLWRAGSERPESLAAMIHTLAQRGGTPTPDAVPVAIAGPLLRIDSAMFGPKVIEEDAVAFGDLPDREAVFAVNAVIGPGGRIADYELLGSAGQAAGRHHPRSARLDAHAEAVHQAMAGMRFAPALGSDGSVVAVNTVVVLAKTTATPARPVPAVSHSVSPTLAPALTDDTVDEADADEDEPAFGDFDSGIVPEWFLPWT